MIQRRSLSELNLYFLSWKYRWFSCSSHSIREILLWYHASLQSTLIIWAANLSLISICFHNVWMRISAKSFIRFRVSWFSWDLIFSTTNSSIFRFMKTKICKDAEIIENKCNWTESKMMICDWSFMILMLKMSKARFLTKLIIKSSFHIYFLIHLSTWYQCRDLTWILDINLVIQLDIDLELSQNSSSWLDSSSNRKFRIQLLIEVSRAEFMILLNDIFRAHDSWRYWLLLIEISRAEFMILLIMQQSNAID